MKIEVSKEQYQDLIITSELSNWILGILSDSIDNDNINYKNIYNRIEKLEKYLFSYAKEFGMENKFENYMGDILLKEEENLKYQEIINDYDDYIFWSELENKLAREEFFKTITEKEKKEIEKTSWLPERFMYIEDKYRKEFEQNGVKNLEIRIK